MWTYLWIHKEVQRWLIKLITPLIVRDRLEQLWFLLWVKPVNGERYCVHWKCFQVKNSSPVTSSAISLCKMYKKKIDWQMETCTQAAELIFPKANSLNGKRGGCCNIGGRRFMSAAKWAHQTKKTCTTASLLGLLLHMNTYNSATETWIVLYAVAFETSGLTCRCPSLLFSVMWEKRPIWSNMFCFPRKQQILALMKPCCTLRARMPGAC